MSGLFLRIALALVTLSAQGHPEKRAESAVDGFWRRLADANTISLTVRSFHAGADGQVDPAQAPQTYEIRVQRPDHISIIHPLVQRVSDGKRTIEIYPDARSYTYWKPFDPRYPDAFIAETAEQYGYNIRAIGAVFYRLLSRSPMKGLRRVPKIDKAHKPDDLVFAMPLPPGRDRQAWFHFDPAYGELRRISVMYTEGRSLWEESLRFEFGPWRLDDSLPAATFDTAPPHLYKVLDQADRRDRVAVLPFEDRTEYPRSVGRIARETVARELAISPRLALVPDSEVRAAIGQRRLRFPLSGGAASKLGRELGAALLVQGAIKPAVLVRVDLSVVSAESGKVIGSAVQIGECAGGPPLRPTDYEAAAAGAAVLAVRRMLNSNVEDIPVLGAVGGIVYQIIIERGARDGLRKGMELTVLRGGDPIATARIRRVYAKDAEADPIHWTLRVQPGDTARAEYKTPYYLLRRGESVHPLPSEFWPYDPAHPTVPNAQPDAPR